MLRKMLLVGAAVAMPLSIIAATGGIASAKTKTTVNVAHDNVTCADVSGTVTFSPPLTLAGTTDHSQTTTVSASLKKCVVSGANAATITKAAVSGTIDDASTTGSCTGLSGATAVTGDLTTTWSSKDILQPGDTSTTTFNQDVGGTYTKGKNSYGLFEIPGAGGTIGVTGDFTGSNGGATSSIEAQTKDTEAQIVTACESPGGLSSLTIEQHKGASAAVLS
jgi:hypothetical protein